MKLELTSVFVVAAFGLAGAACGDDDGGGDSDAAAVTFDASSPDASPPIDAVGTPDAFPSWDAAPPGAVQITVNDTQGMPIQGLDVVFSDASGALVSHQQTDSSGQASETLGGGSMITLATLVAPGVGPTEYTLFTLGDIQPDDDIVVSDFDAVDPGFGNAETRTVTWPGMFTNATDYDVTDGCNLETTDNPANTTDLDISEGCVSGNEYSVVAQAVQSGMFTDTLLAASYSLDETDTGGPSGLTLPAWSDQFQTAAVDILNAPASLFLIAGGGSFFLDGANFDLADDELLFVGSSYDALVPDGITPDATQLDTTIVYGGGMTITGITQISQNVGGFPSSTTEADVALATRSATDGVFDPANPARPTMDWIASPVVVAANFTQVFVTWEDQNNTEEHTWFMLTKPEEIGPIQLPEMPVALSAYEPDDTVSYGAQQVVYANADFITDDWDTLRQTAGTPAQKQPATDFTTSISLPFFAPPMQNATPARLDRRIKAPAAAARATLQHLFR
jgi:hypothetical protein